MATNEEILRNIFSGDAPGAAQPGSLLRMGLDVFAERAKEHGDHRAVMGTAAALISAYLNGLQTSERYSLSGMHIAQIMTLLKIARSAHSPETMDNYLDASVYQAIAGSLAGERCHADPRLMFSVHDK